MKLTWEFQQGSEGLWSRVLKGKYGRGVINLENAITKLTDSSFWKVMLNSFSWLDAHACQAIGNGRGTKAWEMSWIAPRLCVTDLGIDIPANIGDVVVADIGKEDGGWNWNIINWLPANVLNMLTVIPAPAEGYGDDTKFWPHDKHGIFTVRYAYELLLDLGPCEDENVWSKIWKLQMSERVRSFIWLLKHDRLLTNYRKSKMQLGPPYCDFCGDIIETELHVLRDYPRYMSLWLNFVQDGVRETFFASNLQQWIHLNINGDIDGIGVDNWQTYRAFACHAIWTWRNKEHHEENFILPSQPKSVILNRVKDYKIACKENCLVAAFNRTTQQVRWDPPCEGWVVLNTDGAKEAGSFCGCGGIIRGSRGEWISDSLKAWESVAWRWQSCGELGLV
jgi:hypothetical protein